MVETNAQRINKSLERFAGILTKADIQQIRDIQSETLPTGIRINPLKAKPQSAIQALADRYSWQVKPIPFCKNAWLIDSAGYPPGKTIEHRLGEYYLQDAASMVPVSLMEFSQSRPLILDMAASPGGKTTHLIDRTHDRGFILANDASQSRIPALRSVLSNWGGINLAVTNFPGESFGSWFPEVFDMVLLDAPCSMENLRPSPNHPLRETSQAERLRLQERQVQLLISGLQALKIGGQIVYATCSLAPEEGEAVINRVLEAFNDDISIENVSDKLAFTAPGLAAFGDETYDPALVHSLRLWPHKTGMSGFFCARLKKHNAIACSPESPPQRDFSRTHLKPANQALCDQICEQLTADYGFDLCEYMKDYRVELYCRHEGVFLIPTAYLNAFKTLPFEFIGMCMGQWTKNKLQPSHEFISRFGNQFTKGFLQIDVKQVDSWTAGRDIRHPDTDLKPAGQFLLVVDEDGRNLGMGKLLPKRLRNMLPRTSI